MDTAASHINGAPLLPDHPPPMTPAHLHRLVGSAGGHHHLPHKGRDAISLSEDPLLDPAAAANGPFACILPSRKYDGDYAGERVEWLEDGTTVRTPDSPEIHLKGPVREGRFIPQMQREYIERHLLGEMRDVTADGLAAAVEPSSAGTYNGGHGQHEATGV
ncbi:hypothetical protein BV898_17245 [Hypsibius exemplaris]|uniref:Uncharacterized protein n=1 Tax=Hypsibius exemplaris TaxID=2072580 RepID=A0A9X6NF03_HYPEX|nr:hypothetical protein BV898_17245 [Hypsibius exemplaris]